MKKVSINYIIRALAFPITTFFTTFYSLLVSIWNLKYLATGEWGKYNRFTPKQGMNSLFYWTQLKNIDNFGLQGTSPYLGLGNYKLSNWFQVSLPSLYLYKCFGSLSTVFSMFLWLSSHLLWFGCFSNYHLFFTLLIVMLSTSFFSQLFILQNYNAFGWIFFPALLFGLVNGNVVVISVSVLLMSFGSITAVFMSGVFIFFSSVFTQDLILLLGLLPMMLKYIVQFVLGYDIQTIKESVQKFSKSIGVSSVNVKYKRKKKIGALVFGAYMILMYFQFIIIGYLFGDFPVIVLISFGVFVINSFVARFADISSMIIMNLSVGSVYLMNNFSWPVATSFALFVALPPVFFQEDIKYFDRVKPLKPFKIDVIIQEFENFFASIVKNSRVLFAFDDPQRSYEKIFDGYRNLYEVPLYVASKKQFHLMPDWYSVFETNYEGAPDFWGRDMDSVKQNIIKWEAQYVIVYQVSGTTLDSKWEEQGFKNISELDWKEIEDTMGYEKFYKPQTAKWWLLKTPENK